MIGARNAARALCLLLVLAPPAADAELRRVRIDTAQSLIAARTGRAGLLGFLGHDHGILAARWSAWLCVDPEQPGQVRGEISVPVTALRIDTAEALAAVGLDREADEEQRRDLQEKMTGPRYLDAYAHREIRFEPTRARLDDDGTGSVSGDLTIRGVTREITAPVEVSGLDANRPVVEGTFRVRHTDHGMTPESVAGVVKVADEIAVRFRLAGAFTASACEDGER